MSMHKTAAILKKQLKDTLKNKTVFIQFVLFPLFAFVMTNTINMPDMPKNFFVLLFATMYIGMAPLTSMAAIISEEKEKNTLRVLMMSNVKAVEYFIGVSSHVFLICMAGSFLMALTGKFYGWEMLEFMAIMGIGIFISILIGAAIGVCSKNQMSAASLTIPVMLIFSFLPMISMFNEKIARISEITYSQQINNLLQNIGVVLLNGKTIFVILLNMTAAILVFIIAYKKYGIQ